jgi:hypothetical protein
MKPQIGQFDLTDLIDMHIHSAPDVQPRYANDMEIAVQAKQAGMSGVLIKSHVTMTADRAKLAEEMVGGIRVFGGLVLNEGVGGLNPAAVEAAIEMGAKEIWLPTHSAAHVVEQKGKAGGISILNEDSTVCREVYEILDLTKDADIILATGHISPRESSTLVKLSKIRRHPKILITHPEASFIRMPLEMQQELEDEGAFFERCFVDTTPLMNCAVSIEEIAHHIRCIGVESTVLSTDFGQIENPSPVVGFRTYLSSLGELGFHLDELQKMAGSNPCQLLGMN